MAHVLTATQGCDVSAHPFCIPECNWLMLPKRITCDFPAGGLCSTGFFRLAGKCKPCASNAATVLLSIVLPSVVVVGAGVRSLVRSVANWASHGFRAFVVTCVPRSSGLLIFLFYCAKTQNKLLSPIPLVGFIQVPTAISSLSLCRKKDGPVTLRIRCLVCRR